MKWRAALLLLLQLGAARVGAASAGEGWPVPLLTFGLIADPHANINHRQPWWCDLECWRREVKLARSPKGRKHHLVLKKISESVHTLATVPGIAFSVNVGDLCDMDMLVNMPPVLDLWDRLPHPHYNLMGNHDLRAENDRFGEPPRLRNRTQIRWLLDKWRIQGNTFYYEFVEGPIRFIVLDSMTLPPTERRSPLKEEQVRWLAERLNAATEAGDDVIIFAHIPIGLATNELRHVLLKHDNILAVFHGHKHKGGYNYDVATGKHMITLQGMIETDVNAYAFANVFADRIEVVGFGRVPSRVYYRTAKQAARARDRPVSAYQPLWKRYEGVRPYDQGEVALVLAADPNATLKSVIGPAQLPSDTSQKAFAPRWQQGQPEGLAMLSCGRKTCALPERRHEVGQPVLQAIAEPDPSKDRTPLPPPTPTPRPRPSPPPPDRTPQPIPVVAAPPVPLAVPLMLSAASIVLAAAASWNRMRRVFCAPARRRL